jgi:hypothetical protein
MPKPYTSSTALSVFYIPMISNSSFTGFRATAVILSVIGLTSWQTLSQRTQVSLLILALLYPPPSPSQSPS